MPKNKQKLLGDNFDCDQIAKDLLKNLEKTREQLVLNFNPDKLNFYQKSIVRIRTSLPLLNLELKELEQELEALLLETDREIEEIQKLEHDLSFYLKKSQLSDEEYDNLNKKRVFSTTSRERCHRVTIQAENLSSKRENLYLYRMVSNSPIEFGVGFDEVMNIIAPKAKERMLSLDNEIEDIDKNILEWCEERIALNEIIDTLNQEVQLKTNSYKNSLATLKSRATTVGLAIHEVLTLAQISKQNTIYAAAIRGDESGIIDFLPSVNSLNIPDEHKHKPIYYAFRCGHTALATTLMDHTLLTKQDIEEILAALPTQDKMKHSLLVAIIKNKNTFDHLWNDEELIGKNIQNIFQDHFSPVVFNSFSFLSNEVKRALSFNPQRQHLKLAEDIFSFFNYMEKDMLADLSIARAFILSKLKAYHRDHPNDLFNPYARRLFYVQNKLDSLEIKHEFKNALNDLSFFNGPKDNDADGQYIAMTPYNH